MKKFWKEFKEFIAKGNVMDLAVAIIIGTAFNKIVSSLVNDVIMPLVSLIVGGASVADWKWVFHEAEYDSLGNVVKAESALMYGSFIQAIIDFLIIALTVFIMIKIFNASRKRLDEFGHTVVAESKKTWKKLKKHGKKNAEPVTIMAVENKAEATNITAEPQTEQPTEQEVQSINNENQPAVPTEISAEIKSTQSSTNKDEELLAVLKEIRDYMKK